VGVKTIVVDYGMGNIGSILNMIKKSGGDAEVSADPAIIAEAEKLVLPGVGAFDNGMRRLATLGLVEALTRAVLDRGVPILGICLGMQLFTKSSEEGALPGLGWIEAHTVRFRNAPGEALLRIPHMGWNQITTKGNPPLFKNMHEEASFYFVHSFKVECANEVDVAATTKYGGEFVSALNKGNIYATQFHPEKSLKYGMRVMENFVGLGVA
jgi:imidazole glycerol-phosphate synthase subunit HisH